jgi:hypothetical protein
MNRSNSIKAAGNIKITQSILIIAPLAINIHIELMMSISEYTATPKVAANSPIALTTIDGIEAARAVVMESCLSQPF